jgi:phage baseplate assembly protein gpV
MKARGDSGVDMTQVIDDKVTVVGSNPNIFPSCRMDGAGREKKTVSTSTTQGVIESSSTYTEYEAVDNSGDHHGGTYSIVAMNKFAVDAANGGISLNTGGNITLMAGGGIANIVSTECISAISNVIKFVASEISVFKGPELYVETDNTTFVNTVKMAKNLVVQGGALINGELFINHMTAPQQVMDTSMSPILPVFFNTPTILTGIVTQTCMTPTTCGGLGTVPLTPAVSTNYVQFTLDPITTTKALGRVLPHKHTYKHAACSFKQSQDEVWSEAEATNENDIVAAKAVDSFGDVMDRIVSKVTKRATNAFVETMTSLMGGIF